MCKCNPDIRSIFCEKCVPDSKVNSVSKQTKIYAVQEIWGDGYNYPSLHYLKIFDSIDKSISHCQKRFEHLKNNDKELILEDHMVIINEYSVNNPEFPVRFGNFSCFLVKEYEVL